MIGSRTRNMASVARALKSVPSATSRQVTAMAVDDRVFGLTEEQQRMRDTVTGLCRRSLSEEVVSQMDKNNKFDGMRKFWQELGQLGLLGVTVSSEYGGSDMGYLEHAVAQEEISRASGAVGLSYGAHSNLCVNQIYRNGTAEQKKKFLPDLCSGVKIGALAMSEPGAGSDVVSMKCSATAERDASGAVSHYVLNGNKFWITNGPNGDTFVVYAKTDAAAGRHGITAFIVERDTPGFSVGLNLDKLGMRGSPTGELIFDNCRVPAANVLGEVNEGVYVLMSGLDFERLILAAGPVGIMQAACDLAFPYAQERHQFGQPIANNQLIQATMADMYVRLTTTRSHVYTVARALDAETSYDVRHLSKDCAAAILSSAELGTRTALDAIQILGGNGYINDYPAGRLLRDAKLYEIGAGTSEIRRLLIGRAINNQCAS